MSVSEEDCKVILKHLCQVAEVNYLFTPVCKSLKKLLVKNQVQLIAQVMLVHVWSGVVENTEIFVKSGVYKVLYFVKDIRTYKYIRTRK